MEWRGSLRAGYRWWVAGLGVLVAAAGVGIGIGWATGDNAEDPWWPAALCLAVGLLLLLSASLFGRMTLHEDADGAHVLFGPWRWPRWEVPWARVTDVQVVDVRAWPWGGWGMRWRPGHGRAAVLRQGPGVEFQLIDAQVLVVTIDDADEAASVARHWLSRSADG